MENKIIGLKIYPEFFDEVFKGYKTFEVRKNDRDFKVGDVKLTDKDITDLHEKHHLIVNSIKKGYEIVEAN